MILFLKIKYIPKIHSFEEYYILAIYFFVCSAVEGIILGFTNHLFDFRSTWLAQCKWRWGKWVAQQLMFRKRLWKFPKTRRFVYLL